MNPFLFLIHSDKWRERKEASVEILEFRVDKAWLVPGCDRGPGCCPGGLLLRTPERQFIILSGTVSAFPVYDFRWASSYKFGHCGGAHVVIERWPRTKGIYSIRFSGAPVEHVSLDKWEARWGFFPTAGDCDIVSSPGLGDLPEHENH